VEDDDDEDEEHQEKRRSRRKKEHTYKKEMRPIFVLCSLVFVFGGSKKKKYRNL